MRGSQVRIGIVGAGKLGAIHARLAAETVGAELVGLYDTDGIRAGEVAATLGCRSFDGYRDLLDAVDAICVVTPTSTHHGIAAEALTAGRHCFIEKPVTTTAAEAESLAALARSKRLVVGVGHVERFNPAYLALPPDHPTPLFIEAHRLARFTPRATDVAVVLDLMIHDIDLVLALNGGAMPTEIRASGVGVISETIDIANARLEFANGCTANLTASRISRNPMRKMRLFGHDAYISLDFAEPSVEVIAISDAVEGEAGHEGELMLGEIALGARRRSIRYGKPTLPSINPIGQELRLFVEAIRSGGEPPVTIEDGARAVAVAESIIREIEQKGVTARAD